MLTRRAMLRLVTGCFVAAAVPVRAATPPHIAALNKALNDVATKPHRVVWVRCRDAKSRLIPYRVPHYYIRIPCVWDSTTERTPELDGDCLYAYKTTITFESPRNASTLRG